MCQDEYLWSKGQIYNIGEIYPYFTSFPINLAFNSFPNDKIVDLSKLKAFADNKINGTQKLKFDVGGVENTVGKGENAGYQHFLLFPQCFQRLLS